MNSGEARTIDTRSRRLRLLVDVLLVVVAGLVVFTQAGGTWWGGLAGDALYAALIYLIVAIAFPRTKVTAIAAVAFAICAAIELFQLTGMPTTWAETFWPIRLVLGVGFDPLDLVAYAVGAAAAAGYDTVLWSAGYGASSRPTETAP